MHDLGNQELKLCWLIVVIVIAALKLQLDHLEDVVGVHVAFDFDVTSVARRAVFEARIG